ncbi:hypothetical protein [Clostridium sp.]|jgi:hypothetical protein|uniref:hypothetical protein n=1 Tax=Clostridium sp. TaxID=1506 RepID=UPI003EEBD8FD
MAIPNRNDFTLQNVIYELGLASDEGLSQCFSDAVLGDFDSNYEVNSSGNKNNLLNFRNYGASPPPTCTGRVIVFQICNENSAMDDNFDILLNNVKVGETDLSSNSQVGSVFIGSTNTSLTLSDAEADFGCPMSGMVVYYFDPVILSSSNVISMDNTQNNNNSNYGSIGVRNYLINGNSLETPREYTDFTFTGNSGGNFEFTFNFTTCGTEIGVGSLTAFSSSLGFLSSKNDACNSSNTNETYYHDGSSSIPGTGDYVYTNAGASAPLGLGYYKFSGPTTYEIGSSGLVVGTSSC